MALHPTDRAAYLDAIEVGRMFAKSEVGRLSDAGWPSVADPQKLDALKAWSEDPVKARRLFGVLAIALGTAVGDSASLDETFDNMRDSVLRY